MSHDQQGELVTWRTVTRDSGRVELVITEQYIIYRRKFIIRQLKKREEEIREGYQP